jgi:hypothetical protein
MLEAAALSVATLDRLAADIAIARPYRDVAAELLTVDQQRQLLHADRIVSALANIDMMALSPDAFRRFGDMMAAAKGVTMAYVGPVADAFRKDKAAISTIMGPYGSAKTTTAFQKIINSAIWQPPGPDGVRRVRWAVIRDTYGHLETNVMADWFMWFPKTQENYSLKQNTHKLRFDIPLANGKLMKLYIEMLFRAMGDQTAEELAKGLSLTGAWLNEMDTLDQSVFKFLFPRCGRYRPPGTPLGGWSGLIGDMNAPDVDNWTYDFNVNKNIGVSPDQLDSYAKMFGDNFRINFHVQPSGLDPRAENISNLPPGYYERMQIGMTDQEQRRFIGNNFGAVRNGNPVYSQYSDERHCVETLAIDKRVPVCLGIDGGNTPAVLFGQKMADGQVRIVDECVVFEPDGSKNLQRVGPTEYGEIVGEYWNAHFAGCILGAAWADPSAWYGATGKHADDKAWVDSFTKGFNAKAIGVKIKVKPAPVKGNRLTPRLETVRELLKSSIDAQPKYLISARCRVLRQGFNSGYVTVRVQYSTGGGRWKDEPVKNDFSHVHDGNQYLCLGLMKFEGWEDAQGRAAQKRAQRRPPVRFGQGYFSHQGAR